MPHRSNTNPFRNELDTDSQSLYEERRKSRNNPFFQDINTGPGNKPSRPNLNKYSSDNIAPGNKPSRPNLNKYSSDNALQGATPRRSVHRSKTDRANYRHSVGVNDLLQGQRGGSSSHGGRDKNVSSRRHSKVPKELELDTIDKLDVTGIFFGGGFHHDGPFDAARPQRTRHSRVSSPIMAFPRKSSSNNIVRSHTISASSSEVFTGHNGLLRKGTISGQFGSKAKSSMIHGDASVGLGSTTFLDGAPASQEAIKEDIRNHIRRNKTIKDNRRKSIADFLRGDFDLSNVSSSDAVVPATKEPEVKKGNKFLRRIKSLRR